MYLPLGTAGVGADNNAVAHVEVLADPLQHARLGVQVVHGDIEEALDLAGMQIHGDDVVAASSLEHVCHELGSDGRTALILLILTGVREVGDDSSDASGRSGLAGVDHDKKLHETVVDVIGPGGLQDEDCRMQGEPSAPAPSPLCLRFLVLSTAGSERGKSESERTIFVSDTFTDCDAGLLVGILEDHDLGQLNAEAVMISISLQVARSTSRAREKRRAPGDRANA